MTPPPDHKVERWGRRRRGRSQAPRERAQKQSHLQGEPAVQPGQPPPAMHHSRQVPCPPAAGPKRETGEREECPRSPSLYPLPRACGLLPFTAGSGRWGAVHARRATGHLARRGGWLPKCRYIIQCVSRQPQLSGWWRGKKGQGGRTEREREGWRKDRRGRVSPPHCPFWVRHT